MAPTPDQAFVAIWLIAAFCAALVIYLILR